MRFIVNTDGGSERVVDPIEHDVGQQVVLAEDFFKIFLPIAPLVVLFHDPGSGADRRIGNQVGEALGASHVYMAVTGLVDPETITVTLTQIKTSQDLIIDGIEWGTRVKVRSGNGTDIDCFYLVHAERKDGEKLIVEYEGKSSDDYPGDNSIYSINK